MKKTKQYKMQEITNFLEKKRQENIRNIPEQFQKCIFLLKISCAKIVTRKIDEIINQSSSNQIQTKSKQEKKKNHKTPPILNIAIEIEKFKEKMQTHVFNLMEPHKKARSKHKNIYIYFYNNR
eukprot:TRINITY_DN7929_c0_g2_i1.p2 TRINITY_DN7929_c0_g2~~TRINITY_DN7929_c0_g2_i1.p2  ORF type:complete len:123 (+),score=2.24 TRINITY_DN7929_c0_g2_i1:1141-1509(+)